MVASSSVKASLHHQRKPRHQNVSVRKEKVTGAVKVKERREANLSELLERAKGRLVAQLLGGRIEVVLDLRVQELAAAKGVEMVDV